MSKPIEKSSARSEPKTVEGHPTREEIELRAPSAFLVSSIFGNANR